MNKAAPLLSDEQIAYMRMGAALTAENEPDHVVQLVMNAAEGGCRFAMEAHEKDRAKVMEVLQRVVNAADRFWSANGDQEASSKEMAEFNAAQDELWATMDSAKDMGVTPTTP